jgi:hypothetical protein
MPKRSGHVEFLQPLKPARSAIRFAALLRCPGPVLFCDPDFPTSRACPTGDPSILTSHPDMKIPNQFKYNIDYF